MLSTTEIQRFIDDDILSERKQKAEIGQRYYEAKHDILNTRMFYFNADGNIVEDKYRSNIKIPHPFFTELADQLSAYLLSFKETPIRAIEKVDGLQEYLDLYFNKKFWAEVGELVTGAYVKGFEYLYTYKGRNNRLEFQCADSMGVVEVRENDTDDGCKYVIYWYIDRVDKGKRAIKRIQVWSDKETAFFVQSGDDEIILDTSVELNPRPHVVYTDAQTGKQMGYGLGHIPFWRLNNNKKRVSGLVPIKALIDNYDLMQCGLSNSLTDFDHPLYVVTGYQGDNLDELQKNLKTKKIIGLDDDGGVEVKTVDVPYQARMTKAEEDEKNIYRFGMGLDISGLKDTNATTNMAIKTAYSRLELKAAAMETRLIGDILEPVLEVVLAEINAEHKTDYKLSDVEFCFKRDIITNETENLANEKVKAETKQIEVNTILNTMESSSDEQILKAICEVMDWDYEEIQSQIEAAKAKENTAAAAKSTLENAVVDDEQQTERSADTVIE